MIVLMDYFWIFLGLMHGVARVGLDLIVFYVIFQFIKRKIKKYQSK